MPRTDTPPPPTQPNLCPLCATRRLGGPVPDPIGRYSLAYGSQYRCSACDAWLCVTCGGKPVPDSGVRCGVCSTPQESQKPQVSPPHAMLPRSEDEATCIRVTKTKARPCQSRPTEWPAIPGEPAPVPACWVHLSEEERQNCTRARDLRRAERARIWAEGEPERQRRATEAEAERRVRLAACPCKERLPEKAGMRSGRYPAPNRCTGCDSWLCASCDRVRVVTEGAQCETCRPHVTEPGCNGDHTEEGDPYYRITVGGLECFDEAMCLLIRAGAQNGGAPRVFVVRLPICDSQAEALEALETFDSGSDAGSIEVELVPEGTKATVAPGLPEPDLSGLGDIESWWLANGYPAGDKRHRLR